MSGYTQLTREARYQIYMLGKAGHSQAEMACLLERAKATISRELRRSRGRCGYRPKQAQRLSLARRRGKARCRLGPAVWSDVAELLRLEWSPEQISGHLWVERGVGVSPEWIY